MKKILLLIIILLSNFNVQAKTNLTYAIDKANLINKETEDYINLYSNYLKQELNIDYYLITIKNNTNLSIEKYADKIFNDYNLTSNSLLILISKENRQIQIKTGSTISKIIPNTIINDYLNKFFIPFLKNNDWNSGLKNGYASFFKLLCNYYEIDSSVIEVYNGNSFFNKYKNYLLIFNIWLASIICYIYCKYFKEKIKKKLSFLDTLIFTVTIVSNIFLLLFSYFLNPLFCILVLLAELIFINSNYQLERKIKK